MVPFSVSVFCWSYRIPWRRREKYARKKSTIFLPGEIRVGPLSFASFTHRSHRILSLQTRIRNRLRKNKKRNAATIVVAASFGTHFVYVLHIIRFTLHSWCLAREAFICRRDLWIYHCVFLLNWLTQLTCLRRMGHNWT